MSSKHPTNSIHDQKPTSKKKSSKTPNTMSTAQKKKNALRDQIRARFNKNGCVPKTATTSRKCDGLCIQGELLSGIKETKIGHKQTTKYTFQVLLDWDPKKLHLPPGVTLNEDDGSIGMQAFSTKKEMNLPTIPYVIAPHQVVWMDSFKKPEGTLRCGALLNLYNVDITYWYSETKETNRFSFNVQSSTVVPIADIDLIKRYTALPRKLSHFNKPSMTDYYTTPTIIMIKDPTDEDMTKDVGFFAQSPTAASVENAKFTIDIDGVSRPLYDHNYMFQQWDEDGLQPPGYFAATMWGAGDRGPGALDTTFGITDPQVWSVLGPKITLGMEGVLIGYVDRERTKEMDVNGAFYTTEDPNDPQWGVQVKVLRFISDAKRNIRNACFEVTSEFVNKVVFKGETNAQSPFAQQNPWNDGMMTGLINMNEMMGDRNRLYNNKQTKFWFVCEADITAEERDELRELTPEVLSACFTPGKNKNRPPMTFRWKTGVVYAELGTVTGKRKAG